MAANAEQPLLRRAERGQGPVVMRQDLIEHGLDATGVGLDVAHWWNLHAVGVRHILVQHEALDDPRQRNRIVGKRLERCGMASRRRQRGRLGIEGENARVTANAARTGVRSVPASCILLISPSGMDRDQAAAGTFGNGSRQETNSLSRLCQRSTSGNSLIGMCARSA